MLDLSAILNISDIDLNVPQMGLSGRQYAALKARGFVNKDGAKASPSVIKQDRKLSEVGASRLVSDVTGKPLTRDSLMAFKPDSKGKKTTKAASSKQKLNERNSNNSKIDSGSHTARQLIGSSNSELEFHRLIGKAKEQAEAVVLKGKKTVESAVKKIVSDTPKSFESIEQKMAYREKVLNDLGNKSDAVMNDFFKHNPYVSKVGFDSAPDGLHEHLLRGGNPEASRWSGGKIKQIVNATRKFSEQIHKAVNSIPVVGKVQANNQQSNDAIVKFEKAIAEAKGISK